MGTLEDMKTVQSVLSRQVLISGLPLPISATVGGTDVSYTATGQEGYALAGLVVLEWGTWKVLERVSARVRVDFPYVPGFLSFRELPALLEAYGRLTCRPDLWLVDGAGFAHPRRLGLASHFGVTLNVPCVGVAKSRLVGTFGDLPLARGAMTPLLDGEECIGTVLRSRKGCRPLFVSPGHRVGMEQAAELALACCTRYRIPEPTRQAHLFVTSLRREALEGL
jgi:deoxyribonuclease V